MLKSILSKAVFVAAAALVLAAPSAHALKLPQQNLTQLINDAQTIVQGTVKTVTDGIDENGMPYTEVTIAVASNAKGPKMEGEDYTFRQFGLLEPRMVDGKLMVATTPEGFPVWNEGESIVAFMHEPARLTGLQTTAGLNQGLFREINGKLLNDMRNAGLFEDVVISDGLLTDEHRNVMTQVGAVDAAAFIDLVGKAVDGNWIESGEMQ